MSDTTSTIAARAASSLKWSVLAEVTARAISPLVLVVLARLLEPKEFGVVAAATLAITFAQMLWDAGLSRALVQLQTEERAAANVVFWTNIGMGVLSFGVLVLLADTIARWLGAPDSAAVLRVLALQTLIGAFGSVQQSLCVRDLHFRRLFGVRLAAVGAPALVSIPIAAAGFGAWALVGGTLFGQLISVVLLWNMSSWRPSLSYDLALARRLFRFGAWVLLEGIGMWLITSGDNLVVSRLLGVHDLGVYRTGSALVSVIFLALLNPFAAVAYPLFSRLQGDPTELRNAFLRTNQVVVVLAIALGGGPALVAPTVSAVLFGDHWSGVGWVISMLALMQVVGWTVGLNAELYRAMGRPDMNTKLMYAQLLFYLPAYWWGAQQGLHVFCIVRVAVAVLAMPLHLLLIRRLLGLSPRYLWDVIRCAAIAGGAMGFSVWGWGRLDLLGAGVLGLAGQITIGALAFTGMVRLVDSSLFGRLRELVLNRKL